MYSPTSFHRRRWREKTQERNIVAAVLSIGVIVVLSSSLAQPKWFYLKGGSCTVPYLGVYQFFYFGYFEANEIIDKEDIGDENVYHGYNEILKNCVTPQILLLIRMTIAMVFLGIISSLFAFFMDTFGVKHHIIKLFKRSGVGSAVTVLLCVAIVGLCYYISTLIAHQQDVTKPNRGTRVEVKFDVGFYLVTAGGAVAILAVAANLMRRYSPEDNQDDALLDEFDGMETFSVDHPNRSHLYQFPYSTPPPPYTPNDENVHT
ncbi:hypothetical protein CHUAL_007804 [Chamberlinius hualienensis]